MVALPSAEVAVTTICHFPSDRSRGVSKPPSASGSTLFGPTVGPVATGGADAPGAADGGTVVAIGVPSAFAVWTAAMAP